MRPVLHSAAFLYVGVPVFEIRDTGGTTDLPARNARESACCHPRQQAGRVDTWSRQSRCRAQREVSNHRGRLRRTDRGQVGILIRAERSVTAPRSPAGTDCAASSYWSLAQTRVRWRRGSIPHSMTWSMRPREHDSRARTRVTCRLTPDGSSPSRWATGPIYLVVTFTCSHFHLEDVPANADTAIGSRFSCSMTRYHQRLPVHPCLTAQSNAPRDQQRQRHVTSQHHSAIACSRLSRS